MLSPEQIEMRKTRVGGSESPALFGLDKYRSPRDIWKEKLGLAPPFEGNGHTDRGDFLEDGVARWAAKKVGFNPDELEKSDSLLHPKLAHVLATPDRLIRALSGLIVMQVKCPSLNSCRYGWGEPPAKVHAQIQWEMALLEARGETVSSGLIAALIGDDVKVWPVEFEPEVGHEMHERADRWFRDFVLTGVEPDARSAA